MAVIVIDYPLIHEFDENGDIEKGEKDHSYQEEYYLPFPRCRRCRI